MPYDNSNPNDPSQQFTWAMNRLQGDSSQATSRFNDLTNMNSDYNKNFLSMMMKQAQDTRPSEDQLFSLNQRLGGMSSASAASFATRQAAAASSKSNDQALSTFQQGMFQNEKTAQGYLGMASEDDQKSAGQWQDQSQFQQKMAYQKQQDMFGFANQAIGMIGGGFLGGGFKNLFGGGSRGMQYNNGSQDPHYS